MLDESIINKLFSDAKIAKKSNFIKCLKCLDDIYFNLTNKSKVPFPDVYYDQLRDIYEERFGPWNYIGAEISDKKKEKLPYWLGSMDKLKPANVVEINTWLFKYSGDYLIEDKLDGVSGLLMIYPQKGKKQREVRLFTRGDGNYGFDISNLIPYLKLPNVDDISEKEQGLLAIRGELIIKKNIFEKKFSKKYKNARNLVSGVVNSKRVNTEAANAVDFVVYEMIEPGPSKPEDQLKYLHDLGFELPNYVKISSKKLEKDSVQVLKNLLQTFRKKSKYEIDGIILIKNEKYEQITSKNPKYAIAFKDIANVKEATVKQVIWKATRYNYLKPRVEIKPVNVGGVTITYATGFNAKYINENNIGPGTKIEIIRSGEVIPHIVNVIKATKAQMPTIAYHWNKTGVDIIQDEDAGNTGLVRLIYNFFFTLKIRGLGEKTIEKLVECDYKIIEDILKATEDDFINCGFGKKESSNMVNSIQQNIKNVDLASLMKASPFFGFGLGKRRFQSILDEYPKIIEDKHSCKDIVTKVSQIDGWSKTSAEQFAEALPKFKKFLKDNPEITIQKLKVVKGGKFKGHVVVFSGFRNAQWEKSIQMQGGKVGSSVSKNTTLVVAKDPDNLTGKVKKAHDIGVHVLSMDEFSKKV